MGKRSEIKLELSGGMENLQEEESLMAKPGEHGLYVSQEMDRCGLVD